VTLPLTDPAWVFLVLAVAILVAPLLAERLRLPGIVGLVLAGLVLGPHVTGLLERAGTVEQLGGLGLLYLMFLAGLELDIDELYRYRRAAGVFGALTFVIPFVTGAAVGWGFGFAAAEAVVLGLLFASQTLVAYPVVRRYGLVGNRAVAATVGATVITDTVALAALGVVVGLSTAGGGVDVVVRLLLGLAVLTAYSIWVLPRVARWFFAGLGQEPVLRFVFVLAGFLSAAAVGELLGVESIVGAFFAGLALNRLVPNRGTLMQSIEFVGAALLVPLFLISVGMLVDPAVVADPRTVLLAAVVSVLILMAKAAAAWLTGRLFRFSSAEIGVMFGLSGAHAAATLAATIVAFEIGLFDEEVVNAVLLVILVTVVVSSWAARRWGARVEGGQERPRKLGEVVVVPVANPGSAPQLARFAARLAMADGGVVVATHVLVDTDQEVVKGAKRLLEDAAQPAAAEGGEVELQMRVDASPTAGILHIVAERAASLLVLGWQGLTPIQDVLLGSRVDEIVAGCTVPVVTIRLGEDAPGAVVLAIDDDDLRESHVDDLEAAVALCRLLARSGLPLTVSCPGRWPVDQVLPEANVHLVAADGSRVAAVQHLAGPSDLVVLPASHSRTTFGGDPGALAARRPDLTVAVAVGAAHRERFGRGGEARLPGLLGGPE
jgi:Kef-type K+ transport system membrane component KefB